MTLLCTELDVVNSPILIPGFIDRRGNVDSRTLALDKRTPVSLSLTPKPFPGDLCSF